MMRFWVPGSFRRRGRRDSDSPVSELLSELILQENALRVIVHSEGEPGGGQAATSGPKPTHTPNDHSQHCEPWASSPGALQACPGDLLASRAASGGLRTASGCCAPSGQGFGTTASRSTKNDPQQRDFNHSARKRKKFQGHRAKNQTSGTS